MTRTNSDSYAQIYQRSLTEPEAFWAEQAEEIPWIKTPTKVLDKDQNDVWRWFADGELNSCYVALDHHVEQGRGEQTALIYDSPVTNTVAHYTYSEMRDWTARVAGGLQDLGVTKGDVVIILYANGAGNCRCYVGLCSYWRHPLGGVRRFCPSGTGHAY